MKRVARVVEWTVRVALLVAAFGYLGYQIGVWRRQTREHEAFMARLDTIAGRAR